MRILPTTTLATIFLPIPTCSNYDGMPRKSMSAFATTKALPTSRFVNIAGCVAPSWVLSTAAFYPQANHLAIPAGFHIGAYRLMTTGDYKFIRGDDVCNVMHYACTIAYPDMIHHYM
jgi:hypothetical protein